MGVMLPRYAHRKSISLGGAAVGVSFDAASLLHGDGGGGPYSTNLTVAPGATLLLSIVGQLNPTPPAVPVWDAAGANQTMTLIQSEATTDAGVGLWIYGLLSPVSGTKALSISGNVGTRIDMAGASYFNTSVASLGAAIPTIVHGRSPTAQPWNITSNSDSLSIPANNYGIIASQYANGFSSSGVFTATPGPMTAADTSWSNCGYYTPATYQSSITVNCDPNPDDYVCAIGLVIAPP
jgi:hypothetical protein